jgi:two-component system CheB/CheR fusion protein
MVMIVFMMSDCRANFIETKIGKPNLSSRQKELEAELRQLNQDLLTKRTDASFAGRAEIINEELQSTNEELQSTNEELTTSKEEMQSLNEELQTVNAELQNKLSDFEQK